MAGGRYDIWVVNADGTGLKRLTLDTADDYFYSWTPDGSRILFFSNRNGNADLFAMNADGSTERLLLDLEADLWHPVLSKDANHLLFEAPRSLKLGTGNTEPIGIFSVPLKLLQSGQN